MLRLSSNCMMMLREAERRGRGDRADAGDGRELPLDRAATEAAMVSGLAPGKVAVI